MADRHGNPQENHTSVNTDMKPLDRLSTPRQHPPGQQTPRQQAPTRQQTPRQQTPRQDRQAPTTLAVSKAKAKPKAKAATARPLSPRSGPAASSRDSPRRGPGATTESADSSGRRTPNRTATRTGDAAKPARAGQVPSNSGRGQRPARAAAGNAALPASERSAAAASRQPADALLDSVVRVGSVELPGQSVLQEAGGPEAQEASSSQAASSPRHDALSSTSSSAAASAVPVDLSLDASSSRVKGAGLVTTRRFTEAAMTRSDIMTALGSDEMQTASDGVVRQGSASIGEEELSRLTSVNEGLEKVNEKLERKRQEASRSPERRGTHSAIHKLQEEVRQLQASDPHTADQERERERHAYAAIELIQEELRQLKATVAAASGSQEIPQPPTGRSVSHPVVNQQDSLPAGSPVRQESEPAPVRQLSVAAPVRQPSEVTNSWRQTSMEEGSQRLASSAATGATAAAASAAVPPQEGPQRRPAGDQAYRPSAVQAARRSAGAVGWTSVEPLQPQGPAAQSEAAAAMAATLATDTASTPPAVVRPRNRNPTMSSSAMTADGVRTPVRVNSATQDFGVTQEIPAAMTMTAPALSQASLASSGAISMPRDAELQNLLHDVYDKICVCSKQLKEQKSTTEVGLAADVSEVEQPEPETLEEIDWLRRALVSMHEHLMSAQERTRSLETQCQDYEEHMQRLGQGGVVRQNGNIASLSTTAASAVQGGNPLPPEPVGMATEEPRPIGLATEEAMAQLGLSPVVTGPPAISTQQWCQSQYQCLVPGVDGISMPMKVMPFPQQVGRPVAPGMVAMPGNSFVAAVPRELSPTPHPVATPRELSPRPQMPHPVATPRELSPRPQMPPRMFSVPGVSTGVAMRAMPVPDHEASAKFAYEPYLHVSQGGLWPPRSGAVPLQETSSSGATSSTAIASPSRGGRSAPALVGASQYRTEAEATFQAFATGSAPPVAGGTGSAAPSPRHPGPQQRFIGAGAVSTSPLSLSQRPGLASAAPQRVVSVGGASTPGMGPPMPHPAGYQLRASLTPRGH